MIKSVMRSAFQSTCKKRVTVCVILDVYDKVLACESNRCDPPNGICERMGVVQGKLNYSLLGCNWEHAEIRAIKSCSGNWRTPFKVILYGHDFICKSCEEELRRAGVCDFKVVPTGHGTGLR